MEHFFDIVNEVGSHKAYLNCSLDYSYEDKATIEEKRLFSVNEVYTFCSSRLYHPDKVMVHLYSLYDTPMNYGSINLCFNKNNR